jgi:hypothetical protein
MPQIRKTYDKVGRIQLFALEVLDTRVCAECSEEKTSKKWAVLDGNWDHRMCNGCYGRIRSRNCHPYLEKPNG